MPDQQQPFPFVVVLTALLNHPEFQEGLRNAQQTFETCLFADDHEKAWTEEDIIQFVDEKLSQRVYQQEQLVAQVMHWSIPSYLSHLGFTVSYLALALAEKAGQNM